MDWKYIWKYWWEVMAEAGALSFKNKTVAKAVIGTIAGGLGLAVISLVISLFSLIYQGINTSIDQLIQVWVAGSLLAVVLFSLAFLGFVFQIPPEKHHNQELKIGKLERDLSFKGYEDLEISPYDVPWTQQQRHLGMGGLTNTVKIGLKLENKGNLKIRCRVKAVSMLYNGYGHHNWQGEEGWVPAPTPVENRPLKWENEADAKIEIPSKDGFGNLWIAESLLNGSIGYRFCYADGTSDNVYLLDGLYCLNLQVEGDFEKNSLTEGFHPLKYQVVFKHQSHRLELISVERV